jgi:hypothetical protein
MLKKQDTVEESPFPAAVRIDLIRNVRCVAGIEGLSRLELVEFLDGQRYRLDFACRTGVGTNCRRERGAFWGAGSTGQSGWAR